MSYLSLALTALTIAATVFWIAFLVGALKFQRGHHSLRSRSDDVTACGQVKVSVIVPANNEAQCLAECMQSLLAQTYPHVELIIIDDRSSDDTLKIAQQVAAGEARVRVIHVDHLPDDWTGKNHALHRGAQEATGDWLLFTDADTVHRPECLAACLRRALEQPIDLLSGWPAVGMQTWVPGVVDPLCGSVLASWYRKRGKGRHQRFKAFANGQFILVRRSTYQQIGGHEAVREHLLEDIALGRSTERSGGAIEVARLQNMVRVNAYATLAESRRGWSRIFLEASRHKLGRLLRPALVLPAVSLTGLVVIAVALAAVALGGSWQDWWLPLAAVGFHWFFMTLTTGTVCHYARVPRRFALLTPVSAVITGWFLLTAVRMKQQGAAIEWHGVRYPGG